MKLVHFTNQLPSDHLAIFRRLRTQSKANDGAILRIFLQKATQTLREEIRLLPVEQKAIFPPFNNILDLAEAQSLRRGYLGEAIDGVLLNVMHLSLFIRYHELHPQEFTYGRVSACVTVQGYARLAGAAVLVSPTLADLPMAGAEAVRMAIRLGTVMEETSRGLEAREPESTPESWAAAIADMDADTVQEELDAFNTSTHNPIPSQIFISVVGIGSTVISGPPTKINQLFQVSGKLRYSNFTILPIYGGLGHAPHLYNKSHVAKVIETVTTKVANRPLVDTISIFSSADGRRISGDRALDAFTKVVSEVLLDTIRWQKVFDGVVGALSSAEDAVFNVHYFNTSPLIEQLMTEVRSRLPASKIKTIDLVDCAVAAPNEETNRIADDRIAIVGMSCRFPGGANDTQLFWNLLEEGRDVHTKVPADRYDVETHTDPTGKTRNTSLTPFGCFVDQPGLFDAGFFNMSPREAAQTDPMARLGIVTAYEALEQSGFVQNRTAASKKERVGTFYGQACDDYREVNSAQEVDTYYITGGCRAFAPGRINYFFKFSGPSFSCDTACSSSLATIQIACTSLLHNEADTVVAGGMNVLTNVDPYAGLSRGHFLSKTGGCKTWDADADGYCRADGVGSIVMKRLADAEADNDNILGIILASATNHSADAVSITHPHAATQCELYRNVMGMAGVDPMDVGYVELHGTGTQAGDVTEITSVTGVFAPETPRRESPLHIGAVKGNVGHGEAAAGVMALIKVLLMFQNSHIPRHIGIKNGLNPKFPNLNQLNVAIPFEGVSWPRREDKTRYAFVNNFSAAGGNTALLLQEPPVPRDRTEDPRSAWAVAVSGKGKVSLKKNLENMIAHLEKNSDISLSDLSYTTTARRLHHSHRISVTGTSLGGILDGLRKELPTVDSRPPVPNSSPSVAFAFSGQGTFYPGIGRELFKTHPFFRTQILQLEATCFTHGYPSFLPAITGEVEDGYVFGPMITQLTIVCVGIALSNTLSALGIKPSVVVGASLGDYPALYTAGVLSASDAIFLAGERALILEAECTPFTSTMLAVRATEQQIREAANGCHFEVACINGRSDICISATVEEIKDLRAHLESQGFKCHQLNVPFAFHSVQMDPVIEKFERIATGVTFKAPSIPFLSSLLSEAVFDSETINANYMARATRETMNLVGALEQGQEMGLVDKNTVWIDIGPHPICVPFVKSLTPDVAFAEGTFRRDQDNWATMTDTLARLYNSGVEVDWNEWHRGFEKDLRLINLPAYGWNEKNYWMQYNGDWMLTKDQAHVSRTASAVEHAQTVPSTLRTSLIHDVMDEVILENSGKVVVRCDLMRPEFYEAVDGHRMNKCAVITSSIHADVAFTLGKYIYSRIKPGSKIPGVNVTKLEVVEAVVARKDKSRPQYIQISATADLSKSCTQLRWYMVDEYGQVADHTFATATVEYGDTETWLNEWAPNAHLVASRIDMLDRLADDGVANRLTRDLVYLLFNNLVDYSEKYRGMHSVVLHGMEATGSVVLAQEVGGTWTVPPHHIDSIIHLAGFIVNGGTSVDNKNNFFVTPGWKSLRFAKPLVPGGRYRTYVRMTPSSEAGYFSGDVYLLEGSEVIGLCGGMTFRQFPRVLLSKFFSPPDSHPKSAPPKHMPAPVLPKKQLAPGKALTPPLSFTSGTPPLEDEPVMGELTPPTEPSSPKMTPIVVDSIGSENQVVKDALVLLAAETAVDISELTGETSFASIGVDSLLSLVLAEKFKEELGVQVPSSLFLECPTLNDLQAWLVDYS
uniref:Non-reducing polyketide synthase nscA n=1 Tax=Chrysosporium merdarium TaxID=108922 RepID=A0A7H1MHC5_9EURO|nr:polyketide synthase [Chrysosporium merdarium]